MSLVESGQDVAELGPYTVVELATEVLSVELNESISMLICWANRLMLRDSSDMTSTKVTHIAGQSIVLIVDRAADILDKVFRDLGEAERQLLDARRQFVREGVDLRREVGDLALVELMRMLDLFLQVARPSWPSRR
jgi:Mg2+ and Co2+ transporter CorA